MAAVTTAADPSSASAAAPSGTRLPPVGLLRRVRAQQQRVLDEIERLAAGPGRAGPALRGEFSAALRTAYDDQLRPRARELAQRGYHQLRRLRAIEATARGVPLPAVDTWIDTEDDVIERGRD